VKFLHTQMLFLIWVVPILALAFWYGRLKRRRVLGRFAHNRSLAALVPAATSGRRGVRAIFILAGVLLLVLALAGPQYGFQWQQIQREGVDIVIALDCSRSMLSQDIAPTRLDRAKREIIDLLHMLEGDRVALVAFGGTAFLQCPLTLDYQAFDLFLNVLTPDYLPVGGTNLGAALDTAVSAFDPQSAADKAVILITDGENTGRRDPLDAARDAQKAGVKLYCIGVGAKEGVPIPAARGGFEKDAKGQIVLSRLDETTLSRMALTTGGTYVRSVAGDMDLEAVYRERIAADLQAATVESGRKQVWADRFQWPLALSVAMLFIGLWLPLIHKKTVLIFLIAGIALPPVQVRAGALQEGYAAYEKGDYEQALKQFVQGQLHDPDNPRLLYNLGNVYYRSGDYGAAREHYLQALTRLPADDENSSDLSAFKAKLHYNLGNAAYRLQELQAAAEDYETALNYQPDDEQARENLAFVKERMQQQQQQQGGQEQSQADSGDTGQQDGEQNGSSDQAQSGEQQSDQSRGSQNDAAAPPQYGDQTAAGQDAGGDEEQKARPSARAGDPAEQEPGGEVPAPGVQMLNRLKDQPGRAMMPHYQKRQVEKDY
jgi:Ca-activated chloride channel family protein